MVATRSALGPRHPNVQPASSSKRVRAPKRSLEDRWMTETLTIDGVKRIPIKTLKASTELLGEGSFGSVFLASFEGVPCALKTIEVPDDVPNLEWWLEEFRREVTMTRKVSLVSRESVCTPLAVSGEHTNGNYVLHLCMELVQRDMLDYIDDDSNWCLGGATTPYGAERTEGFGVESYVCSRASKLQLAQSLAAALVATHAAGVTHADIKGANCGLCEGLQVKLLDFGSAGISGSSFEAVGSCGYEAPEVETRKEARPASDVYAAGVTLVELWTGQWIASETALSANSSSPAVPNSRLVSLMSQITAAEPDVATILQRCIEVEEAHRPTAKELHDAFKSLHQHAQQRV